MTNHPGSPATVPLSHVAPDGTARMVDVGDKPITARSATAEGFVRISPELARAIRENTVKKGSVLEVARLAGILAAKRTDELIPLCHTLPLDAVDVQASLEEGRVRVTATVRTQSRTGVEMEALTAASAAALCLYDMLKAKDRGMTFEVALLHKEGGKSGVFTRAASTKKGAPRKGTR